MKCDASKSYEHDLRCISLTHIFMPQGAFKKKKKKGGGKHLTHLPSYRKPGIYLVIKTWMCSLAFMDFAPYIFHDFVQSCALYIIAAMF